jgi:hypothetical protein
VSRSKAPALFILVRKKKWFDLVSSAKALRGLLPPGTGFGQFFLDPGRKGLDATDVRGDGPQFLIGIPLTVGEHTGPANSVFRDPKDLCLGVFGAHFRELRNWWEEAAGVVLLFPRRAVAAGAIIEVHLPASDEVLVSRRNGARNVGRLLSNRSVHGRIHEIALKLGRRKVAADFSEAPTQVGETADGNDDEGCKHAEDEILHSDLPEQRCPIGRKIAPNVSYCTKVGFGAGGLFEEE